MKILNLYAGIGGNRKLWGDDHEITAVENDQGLADVYKDLFPQDRVIVGDAHEFLRKNHGGGVRLHLVIAPVPNPQLLQIQHRRQAAGDRGKVPRHDPVRRNHIPEIPQRHDVASRERSAVLPGDDAPAKKEPTPVLDQLRPPRTRTKSGKPARKEQNIRPRRNARVRPAGIQNPEQASSLEERSSARNRARNTESRRSRVPE